MPKRLEVTLLTAPQHPLETLWVVWEQSRHNNPVPSPGDLHKYLTDGLGPASSEMFEENFGVTKQSFYDTITRLFNEEVPVAENLEFVFLLENVPISLREQMVRHRIGTHVGGRLGADIVPDLAESSWWSQTMRVLDMGRFFDNEDYFTPDTLEGVYVKNASAFGDMPADKFYRDALEFIQWAYSKLVEAGIPKEDARQLIPLGATHRLTWAVNLKALMHIIGKRSCWIAQSGLWHDIIQGASTALTALDPLFQKIVAPPCMKGGKGWQSCPFDLINRERITGRDGFPPCPLWLHHRRKDAIELFEVNEGMTTWKMDRSTGEWDTEDSFQKAQMTNLRRKFGELWGFDVDTGL